MRLLTSPNCGMSLATCDPQFTFARSASFSIEYFGTPYEVDEVNSPPPNLRVFSVASPSPLQPRHNIGSPCTSDGRAVKGRRIVYAADVQPTIVHDSLVCVSPLLLLLLHSFSVFAMLRLYLGSS